MPTENDPVISATPAQSPADAAESAAIATLQRLGYTFSGGQLWRPPIGKTPNFDLIDTIRAERDALQLRLNAADQRIDDLRGEHREPAACMVRYRHITTEARIAADGQDHFSQWSKWEPGTVEYGEAVTHPSRNDPVCYEMKPLYTSPPAPVSVVLPERKILNTHNSHDWDEGYADGWGEYDAELKRLNPSL